MSLLGPLQFQRSLLCVQLVSFDVVCLYRLYVEHYYCEALPFAFFCAFFRSCCFEVLAGLCHDRRVGLVEVRDLSAFLFRAAPSARVHRAT